MKENQQTRIKPFLIVTTLLLALLITIGKTTLHAQNDGRKWEAWRTIPYHDSNHPKSGNYNIQYRMEFAECNPKVSVKSALYNYGWQIKHNLKQQVNIELRVEGLNCKGEKIYDTFSYTSKPGEIRYTPMSNWHTMKSRNRVVRLTLRYHVSPSKYGKYDNEDYHIIEIDFEKGTLNERINGKTLTEIQNQTREEERIKKEEERKKEEEKAAQMRKEEEEREAKLQLEAEYNLKMQEARNLENSGRLAEASAKYQEAAALKGGDDQAGQRAKDTALRHEKSAEQLALGDKAREEGRLDDAERHYANARSENPNNPTANQRLERVKEEKRVKRVEERYTSNREAYQKQENEKMETATALVTGITLLSVLLFKDVGEDDLLGEYNPDGPNFFVNFGYGYDYYPVFQETRIEYYNGNNYNYEDVLENGSMQPFNIHLGVGVRFIRRNFMSLGLYGDGFFGYGLKKELALGGDAGAEINLGLPAMQVFGRVGIGGLMGSYSDVLGEPSYSYQGTSSSRSSADVNFSYFKLGGGIKIYFDAWRTRQHLELGLEYYVPQALDQYATTGLRMSWHASNRLQVTLSYAYAFPRMYGTFSERNYTKFDSITATNDGDMFSIRILRCFDFFTWN